MACERSSVRIRYGPHLAQESKKGYALRGDFLLMKYTYYSTVITGLLLTTFLFLPAQSHAQSICAQITDKPTLYQVTQTGANAALYFTPVNAQTTGYTINYGLSEGDDRYNVDFTYGDSSGAVTYTVGGLDTSLSYFFRVRAKNACSTGPYSDWKASDAIGGLVTAQGGAATGSGSFSALPPTTTSTTTTTTQVPVTGVSSFVVMGLAAAGLIGLGGFLFFRGRKTMSF